MIRNLTPHAVVAWARSLTPDQRRAEDAVLDRQIRELDRLGGRDDEIRALDARRSALATVYHEARAAERAAEDAALLATLRAGDPNWMGGGE